MKTVRLSQLPSLYQAQKYREEIIITLYDNVKDMSTEEDTILEVDMYQIKLPYRAGLLSEDNYEHMLEYAKRLDAPSDTIEERQARDVLL